VPIEKRGVNIMIRKIYILILTIYLVIRISNAFGYDSSFDWPRWRGPNGDGISMETDWNPEALAEGPKILWKMDVGVGYSNVAIEDNRLYTIGMGQNRKENVVSCLNTDNGEVIWQYSFESFYIPQSTPTIDGKYVYALSYGGLLLCLNAKNGKLQWEKDLVNDFESPLPRYGFAPSPVIEGDLVILNAKTSIALNKKTGDKVWFSEMHEEALYKDYYATPVTYNHEGRRYALIFSGRGLFSVDVMTGEKMWYYEWKIPGNPNVADPVVFDNKVFISSTGYSDNGGVLLEMIDNEPNVLWKNGNMGNAFSTSLFINGYLYGSNGWFGPIRLRCLDFDTGSIMWEEEMKVVSLISADGKLIILETDGTLHIAEATPSAYQEISSCDVLEGEQKGRKFWTPPVLCNGKIYVRNYAGDLVCIDVSK
jgi:outer membrane protein assembly factor BamB